MEDMKPVFATPVLPVKDVNQLAPKQNPSPANPVASQVLDETSTIGDIADAVKPAPPPSNPRLYSTVLSVECAEDEEVEWQWTETVEGRFVSGYRLVTRLSTPPT